MGDCKAWVERAASGSWEAQQKSLNITTREAEPDRHGCSRASLEARRVTSMGSDLPAQHVCTHSRLWGCNVVDRRCVSAASMHSDECEEVCMGSRPRGMCGDSERVNTTEGKEPGFGPFLFGAGLRQRFSHTHRGERQWPWRPASGVELLSTQQHSKRAFGALGAIPCVCSGHSLRGAQARRSARDGAAPEQIPKGVPHPMPASPGRITSSGAVCETTCLGPDRLPSASALRELCLFGLQRRDTSSPPPPWLRKSFMPWCVMTR